MKYNKLEELCHDIADVKVSREAIIRNLANSDISVNDIPKVWKPTYNDTVWYKEPKNGKVYSSTYTPYNNITLDAEYRKGNLFKTEKEAEAHQFEGTVSIKTNENKIVTFEESVANNLIELNKRIMALEAIVKEPTQGYAIIPASEFIEQNKFKLPKKYSIQVPKECENIFKKWVTDNYYNRFGKGEFYSFNGILFEAYKNTSYPEITISQWSDATGIKLPEIKQPEFEVGEMIEVSNFSNFPVTNTFQKQFMEISLGGYCCYDNERKTTGTHHKYARKIQPKQEEIKQPRTNIACKTSIFYDKAVDDLTTLFASLTEPKQVYEKVMCDVELPKETGNYNTEFGVYFFNHSFVKGNEYWEGTEDLVIGYWFKPITINSLVVPDLSAMYNELGDLYNLTEDRDKELNYGGQIEMLKLFVKLGYATINEYKNV